MRPGTNTQPDPHGKDAAVIDWTAELVDQLDGHWTHQLRPRLDGLTDEEYLWEPVPGCWNVRAYGARDNRAAIGPGPFTLDLLRPPPSPAPVTTIAWRMAHLIVSVLGKRVAGQFGGPAVSYEDFCYAGTAAEAMSQLDAAYGQWIAGVRGLDTAGLGRPCGLSEVQSGNPADTPLVSLVLHISREVIHHGAEISLLRDLYTPGHLAAR
jgi:DinB superfamily